MAAQRKDAIYELELVVQQMAEEADVEGADLDGFDPTEWLRQWIRQPIPALGGQRPVDLMETEEGLERVRRTLLQMQAGTFA